MRMQTERSNVTLRHSRQPNLFVDPENCLCNFHFRMNSLYYRSFIQKFDSLRSLRMTCWNRCKFNLKKLEQKLCSWHCSYPSFPLIKVLCATTFCKSKTRRCLQQAFFQESGKNTLTLTNFSFPAKRSANRGACLCRWWRRLSCDSNRVRADRLPFRHP